MNAMFCPEYVRLRWLYEAALRHWGQIISVSEIEFCTLYVVAEPWILDWILRFMHATNHLSDTLYTVGKRNRTCRQTGPSSCGAQIKAFDERDAANERMRLHEQNCSICSHKPRNRVLFE
jgi:hypothetical protein